jgi:hypothetical protein
MNSLIVLLTRALDASQRTAESVGERYWIAGLSLKALDNLPSESQCFRIVSGADQRLVW